MPLPPPSIPPRYQQQQAVLSVLFASGSTYTMTTRCINQRQEPVRAAPPLIGAHWHSLGLIGADWA